MCVFVQTDVGCTHMWEVNGYFVHNLYVLWADTFTKSATFTRPRYATHFLLVHFNSTHSRCAIKLYNLIYFKFNGRQNHQHTVGGNRLFKCLWTTLCTTVSKLQFTSSGTFIRDIKTYVCQSHHQTFKQVNNLFQLLDESISRYKCTTPKYMLLYFPVMIIVCLHQ